jgi:hypothetical protein
MRLAGMLLISLCASGASADPKSPTYKSLFVPGAHQCDPGTAKTDEGTYFIVVEEVCEGQQPTSRPKCTERATSHVTAYMKFTTGPAGQKVESWEEPTCLKYED